MLKKRAGDMCQTCSDLVWIAYVANNRRIGICMRQVSDDWVLWNFLSTPWTVVKYIYLY